MTSFPILCTLVIFFSLITSSPSSNFPQLPYTASVYETLPISQQSTTVQEALATSMKNIEILEKLVKENPADIHTFSEYGITGTSFSTKEQFLMYGYPIPTPKQGFPISIGESYSQTSPLLYSLAKLARDTSSYIVANLPDRQYDSIYNTNIALNRQGQLISKYHKTHLFISENTWCDPAPPNQEFVPFNTDFGEKFGMFICFDIFFADVTVKWRQMGITSLAYSTYWMNNGGFPMANGPQVQHAFAHISRWIPQFKLQTILAANDATGFISSGSGIYSTQPNGILNYTFNPLETNQNTVIIYNSGNPEPLKPTSKPGPQKLLEAMSYPSLMKIIPLTKSGIYSATLNDYQETMTCTGNFSITFSGSSPPNQGYPALFLAGGNSFDNLINASYCGLIHCPDASCRKVGFNPISYSVTSADLAFTTNNPQKYTASMYFISGTDNGQIADSLMSSSYYDGSIPNTSFGFTTRNTERSGDKSSDKFIPKVANFYAFAQK